MHELESRIEKLLSHYHVAGAQVLAIQSQVLAQRGATRKQRMRLLMQADGILYAADKATRPQAAALLRQAYVRSARSVQSDFKMSVEDEAYVQSLVDELRRHLHMARSLARRQVQAAFSRTALETWAADDVRPVMAALSDATGQTMLEEHAGDIVRAAVDIAQRSALEAPWAR